MHRVPAFFLCPSPWVALWVLSVVAVSAGNTGPEADRPAPTAAISIEEAIALTLAYSPDLRAARYGIEAMIGLAAQAGARPNPEVEVEVEDVGIAGGNRGLGEAVLTLRLAQTMETGGKRGRRRDGAAAAVAAERTAMVAGQQGVVAQTRRRLIDLAAAQERCRILQASWESSNRMWEAACERVRLGDASPIERIKAEAERAARGAAATRAERERRAAAIALGACWGLDADRASSLLTIFDLAVPESASVPAPAESLLTASPGMAAQDAQVRAAAAALAEAQASRFPDITAAVGISHAREYGRETLTLALTTALPLFDRKQGSIAAGRGNLAATLALRQATLDALRAEVAHSREMAAAAMEEAESLATTILPAAMQAFTAAEEAYRLGQVGYLEVIDAQEVRYDLELQHIAALTAYHQAVVDIDQAIGRNPTADRAE